MLKRLTKKILNKALDVLASLEDLLEDEATTVHNTPVPVRQKKDIIEESSGKVMRLVIGQPPSQIILEYEYENEHRAKSLVSIGIQGGRYPQQFYIQSNLKNRIDILEALHQEIKSYYHLILDDSSQFIQELQHLLDEDKHGEYISMLVYQLYQVNEYLNIKTRSDSECPSLYSLQKPEQDYLN